MMWTTDGVRMGTWRRWWTRRSGSGSSWPYAAHLRAPPRNSAHLRAPPAAHAGHRACATACVLQTLWQLPESVMRRVSEAQLGAAGLHHPSSVVGGASTLDNVATGGHHTGPCLLSRGGPWLLPAACCLLPALKGWPLLPAACCLPLAACSQGVGAHTLAATGPDWTGLGLDWTGLDWTGLDWTGLDWTGLGAIGCEGCVCPVNAAPCECCRSPRRGCS